MLRSRLRFDCLALMPLFLLTLALCTSNLSYAQAVPATGGASNEAVDDLNGDIQVGADKISDAEIQKRITELFANIDALNGVQSQVTAGVVRLTGSLASQTEHEKALRLVHRVDGVVAVNDQIEIDPNITRRMQRVTHNLIIHLFEVIAYLPLLVVALGFFLLFWLTSSLLVR